MSAFQFSEFPLPEFLLVGPLDEKFWDLNFRGQEERLLQLISLEKALLIVTHLPCHREESKGKIWASLITRD